LSAAKVSDLRYGENPHQKGAWYSLGDRADKGRIAGFTRLQGKALSFNNILDLDIARQIVRSLGSCACVIIKHNNPCGVAEAHTLRKAFLDAFASDPLSAFGGVVGFNKKVDGACAATILKQGFIESVMAPGFSAEARRIFSQKKNLILATALSRAGKEPLSYDMKKTEGGFLVQDKDTRAITPSRLKIVSGKRPTRLQERSLLFAWQVARFVKSNAIVIAKNTATVGIGMGQTSRVDSVFMALKKAGPRARGACMASDGFFPKPDSILLAAKAGVTAVIQPGGSVKDDDVIAEASRRGIRMVMTGVRHFRH
jgi:phosphoribosylaminoimidazolecarboxamide formyltransferase/IMP cyclohydrolase